MRLPKPLLRRNPKLNKNDFGHVLVIAGSPSMLGAAALTSLAAMRSGSGLVTVGVAKGLNLTLQQKISAVVMTWPLPETRQHVISFKAYALIKQRWSKYQSIAIGPGLGLHATTKKLVRALVEHCPLPMVVDADALNALSEDPKILQKAKGPRILTPHAGEMSRLTGLSVKYIEANRRSVVLKYAKQWNCIVLLKGLHTLVVSPDGETYLNRTGNVGMATAGSGDVLTGIIAGFLAQGISVYQSVCLGAHYHGKAGDRAVKGKSKSSLIATDIIDKLSQVLASKKDSIRTLSRILH